MNQVYLYRGLDASRRPVSGKMIAENLEEAQKQARSFCSTVEDVRLDSKQPPPGAIDAYRQAVATANQPIVPGPQASGPLVTEDSAVAATPDVAPPGLRTGPVPLGTISTSPLGAELPAPKKTKQPDIPAAKPQVIQKAITEAMSDIKEYENPPERLDNTHRETVLYGDYNAIKQQLDMLLDRQDGTIKAMDMKTDNAGKVVLCFVIKHKRK